MSTKKGPGPKRPSRKSETGSRSGERQGRSGRGRQSERGSKPGRTSPGDRGNRSSDRRRPKRSLTMPRAAGSISTTGDPALAEALADALRAANRDRIISQSLTHPFHSYPARMHPATARALVELLVGPDLERGGSAPRVVDPFCGSGTTLVEARFAGAAAFGLDANPLAVRIARAKTWTALRRERQQLRTQALRIADRSIAETKAARRSGYEAPPQRKRRRNNDLIDGWFPKHVRRELEYLYTAILARPQLQSELLSVALSAVLHKVSFRSSDTDRRKVERRIARGFPTRLFRDRVDLLCAGLDDMASASRAPIPEVVLGDARDLPKWSAEAIITSPPYPGTYDYAEHHDLRLAFLELDASTIEKREIGARRHQGRGSGLKRWRDDTREWLESAAKVIAKERYMALVVGDSIAGKTAVFAERELPMLVPDSLELAAVASQTRPKLGGLERSAFGDKAKREHIVLFRRR